MGLGILSILIRTSILDNLSRAKNMARATTSLPKGPYSVASGKTTKKYKDNSLCSTATYSTAPLNTTNATTANTDTKMVTSTKGHGETMSSKVLANFT